MAERPYEDYGRFKRDLPSAEFHANVGYLIAHIIKN